MLFDKKIYYFFLVGLGILFNMFMSWENVNFLTPDSKIYIAIAERLPNVTNSMAPFLYPLLLKLINYGTADFVLAAKILNIFLLLFSLVFTKVSNFFWKEIWVVLSFASSQFIFGFAWSENLIIPLLIMVAFCNSKFLDEKMSNSAFVLNSVILLLLMVFVRYSSLFIVISYFLYSIILHYKREKIKAFLYLKTAITVSVVSLIYLLGNKYFTGFMTGNRSTLINEMSSDKYFVQSLFNIPITLTPIDFSLAKIFYNKYFMLNFPILWKIPFIISALTILSCFYYIFKHKKFKVSLSTSFFLLSSFTFLFMSFVSGYYTRIDVLGPRLLVAFYLLLLIGVIEYLNDNNINIRYRYLLILGCCSNVFYTLSILFSGYE